MKKSILKKISLILTLLVLSISDVFANDVKTNGTLLYSTIENGLKKEIRYHYQIVDVYNNLESFYRKMYSEPSKQSDEVGIIPAGSKITVLKTCEYVKKDYLYSGSTPDKFMYEIDSWCYVSLSDGKAGWVNVNRGLYWRSLNNAWKSYPIDSKVLPDDDGKRYWAYLGSIQSSGREWNVRSYFKTVKPINANSILYKKPGNLDSSNMICYIPVKDIEIVAVTEDLYWAKVQFDGKEGWVLTSSLFNGDYGGRHYSTPEESIADYFAGNFM